MPATRVDLIGVPSDLGVRELGVSLGPTALRLAGLVDILAQLGVDVRDQGDIPVEVVDRPDENPRAAHLRSIERYSRLTAEKARESMLAGRTPVCIGGDHSFSIGSVAGVASVHRELGVVWIDAHPDANTPDTTLTGNVHGMPVAVLLGYGPPELTGILGEAPKVLPEHLCIVGARDIDPDEGKLIDRLKIKTYRTYDIDGKGIAAVTDEVLEMFLRRRLGLHVSLDLDALTKSAAPGVGIPNSAGLTLREAHYLCKQLGDSGIVTSIDVASMNPVGDLESRTAHTAIELLCLLLGREFSFDYGQYLRRQRAAARPVSPIPPPVQ